jgi:secreted protein with Ig-like and vWFA domain
MAKPIYKVFMFKPTEAWYQLSDQKKNAVKKQLTQALEKVGGKEIILCYSGWNSEQYMGWGVEQFPDIEAVQKHHALLEELDWFRYAESNSYLGTEMLKA